MYFLRFTQNPADDLERGYSFHQNDDGDAELLSGLCGFRLEAENVSDAIEEAKERFADMGCNTVYNLKSWGNEWAIFEGEESDEWLPDGHIFIPKNIVFKP